MTSDGEDRQKAESLLAGYLGGLPPGEEGDMEGLCARHPDQAAELRRLWAAHREAGPLIDEAVPHGSGTGSFFRRRDPRGKELREARVRPEQSIAEYRLIELLDSGGMGEVWEAEQLTLKRRVALKLILPERVSAKTLALFAREARAGGRLAHPGLVAVHDYGTSEGLAWIAMELVEGSWTLRDFLAELAAGEGEPSDYSRRVADFVAQVSDALHAAHQAGVVHRDVKPRNILITPDDRPKVTDFGLARIEDETALSVTGDLAGTYAYMSPEQVAARRTGIDHRTDVFSLGVVLYEALARRRPFEGETSREIADKILVHDPPDLRTVDSQIPRNLSVICGKAIEKDRRNRYSSMAELGADLRCFLRGEPILARPPGSAQRIARWCQRHSTASAIAATAGLSLLVFYLWTRSPRLLAFSPATHVVAPVAEAGDVERSPTFYRNRFLLYERGTPPRIWWGDLEQASRSAQPLSPAGQACGEPAVSPDGKWLTYVSGGGQRQRLLARPVEWEGASGPEWGDAQDRVIARGAVGGVHWSPDSRGFLYTHSAQGACTLMFHDVETGDSERVRAMPRESQDLVHACFSPNGEQIVVGHSNAIEMISPGSGRSERVTLAAGDYLHPVWLQDGSILAARTVAYRDSFRIVQITGTQVRELAHLAVRPIERHSDLALSPDQSMLAWTTSRISVGRELTLRSDSGEDSLERLSFPPWHFAWSPDGKEILYCGDTQGVYQIHRHRLGEGVDERLEVAGEINGKPLSELPLVQPAFSQNGERLVFRINLEADGGGGDDGSRFVVVPWPPGSLGATILRAERHSMFPHVSDDGRRMVWVAGVTGAWSLRTAEVADGRLTNIRRPLDGTLNMARLSGDGQRIAVLDEEGNLVVLSWEGEVLHSIPRCRLMPIWRPGPGYGLVCPSGGPEGTRLLEITIEGNEARRVAGMDFPPSVTYFAYDGRSRRTAFRLDPTRDSNVWLARPKRSR